jgi:predicted Zn-dependent peptidase
MEHTCYHAKVIDNHLETMIDILSDIFLNSVFDTLEIEKERPVIYQEIGMVEDSPEEYIHILSSNNFWGDNPLGRSILGTPENISNFNSDAIKDFFKRFYQPDRIVITAAGNLEHKRFVDLICPAFETIHSGNGFPERCTPKGRSNVSLHQKQLEQAHICVGTKGLPLTDPRRYAFSLLNSIFGGNMSSRLFQEIRERRGLAYSIYSFISSHVDTGMFGVYVGVDPKKIREVITLIFKEMRRLVDNRVDLSELNGAKEFTKGNLLLSAESVDNQMVRLAQNEIHLGAYQSLRSIMDKIESTKAEEIVDLAANLFQPETLALTILGPVSKKDSLDDIPTF